MRADGFYFLPLLVHFVFFFFFYGCYFEKEGDERGLVGALSLFFLSRGRANEGERD